MNSSGHRSAPSVALARCTLQQQLGNADGSDNHLGEGEDLEHHQEVQVVEILYRPVLESLE